MPAWLAPAIISGLSALGGYLTNRKKARTAEQTQQTTQQQATAQQNIFDRQYTTDMTTMPQYAAGDEDLKNFIISRLRSRAEQPFDVRGFAASGLQSINRASAARAQVLQNALRSKGLAYSPVSATAPMTIDADRLTQMTNLLNQLPLMQYGLERESLGDLSQFFGQLPYGQTQTGQTSETGTTTSTGTMTGTGTVTGTSIAPGSAAAGAISGLGQGLASTYGWQWALDQALKARQGMQFAQPTRTFIPPTGQSAPNTLNYFPDIGRSQNTFPALTPQQIQSLLTALGISGGIR